MPYSDGNTPELNDRVEHIVTGRFGRVTDVQLGAGDYPGRDHVSIEFDDGSSARVSLAQEYVLVSRG